MTWLYEGEYRVLSHPAGRGSWNMSVDDAICRSVIAGSPTLRFYGFSPPTLSVGRFQKTTDSVKFNEMVDNGIDFVRRPTGGQGIFHDNELTYSFIIAKKHVHRFQKRELFRFISDILVKGLAELGIESRFSPDQSGSPLNPNCFGTTGMHEVQTMSGKKIIGSAQVTTRDACLQHGSIPIDGSFTKIRDYILAEDIYQNQGVSFLESELGGPLSRKNAEAAMLRAFSNVFPLRNGILSSDEVHMARVLDENRYSTEEWNTLY